MTSSESKVVAVHLLTIDGSTGPIQPFLSARSREHARNSATRHQYVLDFYCRSLIYQGPIHDQGWIRCILAACTLLRHSSFSTTILPMSTDFQFYSLANRQQPAVFSTSYSRDWISCRHSPKPQLQHVFNKPTSSRRPSILSTSIYPVR